MRNIGWCRNINGALTTVSVLTRSMKAVLINSSIRLCFLFAFVFLLNADFLMAQKGFSTSSVNMNKANRIASPDQVVVEEYLNFHDHKIPRPAEGESIALSTDYFQVAEDQIILQVGIATGDLQSSSGAAEGLPSSSKMLPINVALVIDQSGSMQSERKLEKVKIAMRKFVQGLRPDDYISIIGYDNEARVILEAQKVGEVENLVNIIESISSGGSTNLHAGLIMGYEEVEKNLNPKITNKVVLLTDGIVNMGETNPEKIVADSYKFNKKGIGVSTIGVGSNLNFSLLQQISKMGRGANHFVGNEEEDITKVFDNELESLLSPVAKNVSLELELPDGVSVTQVYGYTPIYKKKHISILLKDLNNGLTQVILYECKLKSIPEQPFKVSLVYSLHTSETDQAIAQEAFIEPTESTWQITNEVVKNYYIGKMASSLKEAAKKGHAGKVEDGKLILTALLDEMDVKFPNLEDPDVLRVKNILLKNKKALEK